MVSKVRETLELIGAIAPANVYQYASKTRDRCIPVYRDANSGVIFIDEYYVGDDEYLSGKYRDDVLAIDYEDLKDTQRRVNLFQQFHVDRRILDFGCGAGSFLRAVRSTAGSTVGIELQRSFNEKLNRDGIPCFSNFSELPSHNIDTAFMFHVLEHLPDPLSVLRDLRAVLNPATGILIVEVPHANDFLISQLKCRPFIDFTLWSQHLVLHTRDSLRKLLVTAGFSDIQITGVQRYGLANHINWLNVGKPGGHKAPLSLLETPQMLQAYESALAAQDCTDTLVAIAKVS